jgi:hypothetical protein
MHKASSAPREGVVTRRPQRQWPPTTIGRGRGRYWDPFYAFEQLERDDGKPYRSPEPKVEQELLSLLASKTALWVMTGLLVVVAATVLVLLVVRM